MENKAISVHFRIRIGAAINKNIEWSDLKKPPKTML